MWFRLLSPTTLEPAEIKSMPKGPFEMMLFIVWFSYITSARVYLGITPNITSTLARPKSASKIITFFPSLLSQTARLTDVLDLPTPPLPLVMVITRAGSI